MPRWSSRWATTFVARCTALRSTSKPAKVSLCLLRLSAIKGNKEQRAVMCGCIDLILHRLRWETSGWRGWEMKSGIGSFLNGSNYRLSATLRQHIGLDLALVDACSCYTSSTSRHHKDRATQRLQHDYDSCLTTCPCILFERDLSIQKLVADDQVLEGLTRPGHSPYSSFANGRCIA